MAPAADPSDDQVTSPSSLGHKRSLSGGLLSKLSFLRASAATNMTPADQIHGHHTGNRDADSTSPTSPTSPKKSGRAMAVAVQQQKTRRRKGSLRKAALLGRGIQREKRELETSPLHTRGLQTFQNGGLLSPTSPEEYDLNMESPGIPILSSLDSISGRDSIGRLSHMGTHASSSNTGTVTSTIQVTSPTTMYASTTDEEEGLTMAKYPPSRNDAAPLSGSDAYFGSQSTLLTRRRSSQNPNSPLSLNGQAVNPIPAPDADWDYSETEWWGWVVLIVTWIVFVTGMGSCLGVWSWAWDVGETPYAPPELEDDPTLPIVGYYPALIILTAVMAWVWVVVAWVGMKYFKHAKISGD